MNRITIMGRLGSDPEVRFTSTGLKVTTLRVATNDRKSNGQEDTIWWRVTIWGEQMDKIMSYFKKGSAIIAIGRMSKPEIYNNRDGVPTISLNMVAFDISFSPFGKSENSNQNNQFENKSKVKEEDFETIQQGKGGSFESKSDDNSFNEEEIIF